MQYTYEPEEFEKRVKYYFQECEDKRHVFPDESGMLNFLDIDDEEYELLKDEDGYNKIIRWAKRRRTSWLERHMVENNRAANGCMNALKQAQNGGFSDRPAEKKDRKLIVKLEGLAADFGKEKK